MSEEEKQERINFEELLLPEEIIFDQEGRKKAVYIRGLRRLAREYDLIISKTCEVAASYPIFSHRLNREVPFSSVVCTIMDQNGYSYSGCADAYVDNVDGFRLLDEYDELNKNYIGLYPTASAQTRAEARALKDLLGIDILCAEEVSTEDKKDIGKKKNGPKKIHDSAKNLIMRQIDKFGIDWAILCKETFGKEIQKIDDLSEEQGKLVMEYINKNRKD